ncbi:hypothetical protein NC652_004952 [Populus alba x Populus x berolinensis]|nr:hypothetical protein NC652_004952 [Populus alba x Populus x berolinensis]
MSQPKMTRPRSRQDEPKKTRQGLGKRLIQLLYAYKYADHDFGPDPLYFLCPRLDPNGLDPQSRNLPKQMMVLFTALERKNMFSPRVAVAGRFFEENEKQYSSEGSVVDSCNDRALELKLESWCFAWERSGPLSSFLLGEPPSDPREEAAGPIQWQCKLEESAFGRITIEAMAFHCSCLWLVLIVLINSRFYCNIPGHLQLEALWRLSMNGTTGLLHPIGKEGVIPTCK